MDLGIAGKTALVLAASKGLGYASALELAREGAKVAICSRTREDIDAAAERIRQETGAAVISFAADVTRTDDLKKLVADTQAAFGSIDILVPNSGGPPAGTFEQLDDEKWQAALDSTLFSLVTLTREVLPGMKAKGWGRVVVITSTSVKQPIAGLLLSNTIRAGVVGLLKTLSNEYALSGITFNNVAPGSYDTDRLKHLHERNAAVAGISFAEARKIAEQRIPAGRLGRPEELAAAVAFLASERASYITGQTWFVDGGQTASL